MRIANGEIDLARWAEIGRESRFREIEGAAQRDGLDTDQAAPDCLDARRPWHD